MSRRRSPPASGFACTARMRWPARMGLPCLRYWHRPDVQTAYLNALLLACAQPASFTSAEIRLVIDYIARFGSRAVLAETDDAEAGGLLDRSRRDAPPTAVIRRPAPWGAAFLLRRLAELAENSSTRSNAASQRMHSTCPGRRTRPWGTGCCAGLRTTGDIRASAASRDDGRIIGPCSASACNQY